MSDIYESITLDLDKITDEYARRIAAATDELMDEKLASIGYVKVVWCMDCKRFSGYELEPHFGYCERYDLHEVRGNGFCAWGERRDA